MKANGEKTNLADSSFPHLALNLYWKMEVEVCKSREVEDHSISMSQLCLCGSQ